MASIEKRLKKCLSKCFQDSTDKHALKEYHDLGGDINRIYKKTSLLCEACRHDDLERVQWLLSNGANVDIVDDRGCTALYIAASHGHDSIVNSLIGHHANVDIRNKNQYSALVSALQNGHYNTARSLIAAGADVNVYRPNTCGTQVSLLTYVLFAKGHWSMAECLIRAGILPIRFQAPLGFILLEDPHLQLDIVKLLIQAGFNLYVDGWVDLVERKVPDYSINEKQMTLFKLLQEEHSCPRSLQQQCLVTVRKALVRTGVQMHIEKKADLLPLPKDIIKYLKLEFI